MIVNVLHIPVRPATFPASSVSATCLIGIDGSHDSTSSFFSLLRSPSLPLLCSLLNPLAQVSCSVVLLVNVLAILTRTPGVSFQDDEDEPVWLENSPPVNMPYIPLEIWEHIIDQVEPILHKSTLRACSLVCRSWVFRFRYRLCSSINLSSKFSLESASKYLKSAPDLPTRVISLVIVGGATDDTWISALPRMMPWLPNLDRLTLRGVDLTCQHPSLQQCFKLLPAASLALQNVRYTRYPQIGRLVSAIHPSEDLSLSRLDRTAISHDVVGKLTVNEKKLQKLVVVATWQELAHMAHTLDFTTPKLHLVRMDISDFEFRAGDREFVLETRHVWEGLGHIYGYACAQAGKAKFEPLMALVDLGLLRVEMEKVLQVSEQLQCKCIVHEYVRNDVLIHDHSVR